MNNYYQKKIKLFIKNNYGMFYFSFMKAGLLALAVLFAKYFQQFAFINFNRVILFTFITVSIFDILLFYIYLNKIDFRKNILLL